MKNNNILTVVLALIVGISIGIFGLSIYQNINNINNNNNQEENANNNQNQVEENNTVTSVDFETANKLFRRIIIDQPSIDIVSVFEENQNKKAWTVDELDADYLVEIISKSTKLQKAEICGTQHETYLIQQGIISVKNEGQWHCERNIFYTIDSIKEASKEVFGKELTQFTMPTRDENSAYYYYQNGNIGVFRFAGVSVANYTVEDYYVKNAVLSIEFSNQNTKDNYKINFKVSGANFYFESIEKLS